MCEVPSIVSNQPWLMQGKARRGFRAAPGAPRSIRFQNRPSPGAAWAKLGSQPLVLAGQRELRTVCRRVGERLKVEGEGGSKSWTGWGGRKAHRTGS
jgi:hypothetical protein